MTAIFDVFGQVTTQLLSVGQVTTKVADDQWRRTSFTARSHHCRTEGEVAAVLGVLI